jgi:hypothetical protein
MVNRLEEDDVLWESDTQLESQQVIRDFTNLDSSA